MRKGKSPYGLHHMAGMSPNGSRTGSDSTTMRICRSVIRLAQPPGATKRSRRLLEKQAGDASNGDPRRGCSRPTFGDDRVPVRTIIDFPCPITIRTVHNTNWIMSPGIPTQWTK